MKKHLLRLSIIAGLFFGPMTIKSQPVTTLIAAWDFTGESALATSTADIYDANLDASNLLTRGAGAAASAGANSFRTVGFKNDGISTSNTDYFQFTLSGTPGYTMSLSAINAKFAGTATFFANAGVTSQFAYSLDGTTFTLIGPPMQITAAGSMPQIDVSAIANLQNIAANVTVTFRYYASGQTATGGWGFNSTASGDYGLAITGSLYNPTAPVITVSNSNLIFPPTAVNATSAALSYTVKGVNLTDPLVVSVTAPYSVSDAVNGTYTNSLTLAAADVTNDKAIFVKFSPTTPGTFTDTIKQSTTGSPTKIVAVTGDGIDPANLSFSFDNCTTLGVPGLGFTPYSVIGAQKWACSNFGRNATKGVDINGYAGSAQENEDWLISPPLNVASVNLPVLSFWSKGEFTGPSLQLLISTNYDGSSDPNTATWTDLQANFPSLNGVFTLTDGIDLSAYKGAPFYIAFKYFSSAELGAARWTIDDININNRTQLLTATPLLLNFDEVISGSHSAAIPFTVKSIGFGDVTLTAPTGYELSSDNANFSASLIVSESSLAAGANLYARFSPIANQLKISGLIHFVGTGLDSSILMLTGSSYPKSTTFDAGCYNLSFFGSNATNNPTQAKIDLQVANIATVINKLNLDILGIEEVSNDVALDSLLVRLTNRTAVISNRWSYSFNPPDPTFPPQKTGFIYDTTTTKLVSSRDMFVDLYDKARTTNPELLPNYPGGTPSSFWASGRLPFMATFDVTISGVTKRIVMIDIHAKSASDVASYNRRVYDAKVLKDSLDAYYASDNVIIVGDYNDRVYGSIYAGSTVSPYQPFVADNSRYNVLTRPLDSAGRVSFLTGSGLIDQITITTPLVPFFITNSTDIQDPRSYISNYSATTASDHMPVFTRFDFTTALPVTLTKFNAQAQGKQVLVTWSTSAEYNNNYFVVERSADARTFIPLGVVKGAGNSNTVSNYQLTDSLPLSGINYYRLKQVDRDGKVKYSLIVAVSFGTDAKNALVLYPNPVSNHIQLSLNSSVKKFVAKVTAADGRVILNANGDITQINQQINQNLYKFKSGVYVLKISNATDEYSVKFIKQ
jgi:trimeric autotransporter adhesin